MMQHNPALDFAPIQKTREELAEIARSFVHLDYDEATNVAVKEDGIWKGRANCYGVLLLTAREAGFLSPEFNLNLPPALWEQPQAKTLWQILNQNYIEVPYAEMGLSDILLLRYIDTENGIKEPHHVAMCVNTEPLQLLHASQQARRVYICNIGVLFERRIESVWKCRNLKP